MGLTSKQWFQIVSGSISSFITAGALFTSLFGETTTLKIIACLGLANIVLSSVGAAVSGPDSQTKQVQNVLDMPGVQHIEVNAKATPDLAKMAVDRTLDKISPAPEAVATVIATAAKGA